MSLKWYLGTWVCAVRVRGREGNGVSGAQWGECKRSKRGTLGSSSTIDLSCHSIDNGFLQIRALNNLFVVLSNALPFDIGVGQLRRLTGSLSLRADTVIPLKLQC